MNKNGQSIIEYIIIITLVIFGVVVMGPYVLRSINAHFKMWNTGVQDSFQENIKQASKDDIPTITTTCSCSDQQGGCGTGHAGSCPAGTRSITPKCIPDGCNNTVHPSCKSDDACCTDYASIGCGLNIIPPTGLPIGSGTPGNSTGLPSGGCTQSTSGCYYGQKTYVTKCSDLPVECCNDSSCNPKCTGQVDPAAASACPGTSNNLNQNYNITYVGDSTICNTNAKCQFYCNTAGGYVISTDPNNPGCVRPSSQAFKCFTNSNKGTPLALSPFYTNWTGFYDFNQHSGTNGNLNITINCNSSGIVDGTCFTGPTGYGSTGVGKRSCPGSCQNITFYGQNGSNTTNTSYSITCGANGIQSIKDNSQGPAVTPASVNGCNWTGTIDVMSLEAGNDMYLTCDTSSGKGVLTQFVEAPQG